jgi:hypothetical protein
MSTSVNEPGGRRISLAGDAAIGRNSTHRVSEHNVGPSNARGLPTQQRVPKPHQVSKVNSLWSIEKRR